MMTVRMKIDLRLLMFFQSPVPILPRWVCSTCEATDDLTGDPRDQRRKCSQFQRASSLLAQVSESNDPETFAEALGNPD